MKEQDGRFNDWPNQDLNVNTLNYYLGALLAELSGPGYQNIPVLSKINIPRPRIFPLAGVK